MLGPLPKQITVLHHYLLEWGLAAVHSNIRLLASCKNLPFGTQKSPVLAVCSYICVYKAIVWIDHGHKNCRKKIICSSSSLNRSQGISKLACFPSTDPIQFGKWVVFLNSSLIARHDSFVGNGSCSSTSWSHNALQTLLTQFPVVCFARPVAVVQVHKFITTCDVPGRKSNLNNIIKECTNNVLVECSILRMKCFIPLFI